MSIVRNCVSDPGLHLLAIVILLGYLAQGGWTSDDVRPASKLVVCATCQRHHYPERPCACPVRLDLARAAR